MATNPLDETEPTTSFDLVLPPNPDLLRVVRLVASGLASLTSSDLDAVEGVRVAADELVSSLIQASDGSRVTVTFELREAVLTIHGHTQVDDAAGFVVDPLTDRILDTVATRHEWWSDAGRTHGVVEQQLPARPGPRA